MKTEELNAIREKVAKVLVEPDPEDDLCLICGRQMLIEHGLEPTSTCHECAQQMVEDDLPKLLTEVERLNLLLDMHRGGKNRHEVFLTHPITGKKEFVGTADNDDSSPEPE